MQIAWALLFFMDLKELMRKPYREWTIVEKLQYRIIIHETMGEGNSEVVSVLREAADTIEKL